MSLKQMQLLDNPLAGKQEPVRVMGFDCVCGRRMIVSAEQGVVPAPHSTWVGLTHAEVDSWELPDCPTVFEFAQFIEAKLKQKNGFAEENT